MIYLNGSDLASVYAAALAGAHGSFIQSRCDDADIAIRRFLEILESIDGSPPQIGDPFRWETNPDNLPRQIIEGKAYD